MPEGAACYICLDGGPDEGGKPPLRDCSCHDDAMGFVHPSCLVGYAVDAPAEGQLRIQGVPSAPGQVRSVGLHPAVANVRVRGHRPRRRGKTSSATMTRIINRSTLLFFHDAGSSSSVAHAWILLHGGREIQNSTAIPGVVEGCVAARFRYRRDRRNALAAHHASLLSTAPA